MGPGSGAAPRKGLTYHLATSPAGRQDQARLDRVWVKCREGRARREERAEAARRSGPLRRRVLGSDTGRGLVSIEHPSPARERLIETQERGRGGNALSHSSLNGRLMNELVIVVSLSCGVFWRGEHNRA